MIEMYIGVHVKYPLLLLDFNETWIFLDSFSKNTQISYLMKIRPVGAELLHVDRRTDGRYKVRWPRNNYTTNFNRRRN